MRNRSLALCIVLTIVTCGLYGLYWWACLVDETNIALGETSTSGVMVILLSIITCNIYGLVWAYGMGDKMNRILAQRGQETNQSLSLTYLLLNLFGFGIVTWSLIQNEFNKLTPAA